MAPHDDPSPHAAPGAIVDTHCHLTHPKLGSEVDEILRRAAGAGVVASITIGTGVDDARAARELSRRHAGHVFCTAGLDPFSTHAAGERFGEELERLEALLREGGFCAVGEVGLDYHYDLDPRPVQAERLERQLDLAAALELPVVVHVREAHDDLAAILGAHPRSRGVIHSFTAGPREADRYLRLGWTLAFNGVVTFPSASAVREAVRSVPADRLLVETDSPYLAPVPVRGRRCEPAFVTHTIAAIARERGETAVAVAAATTRNARALFAIAPP